MYRALAVLIALLLCCAPCDKPAFAADTSEVNNALSTSIRRLGLQTELPMGDAEPERTSSEQPPLFEISERTATYALYAAFAVFALLMLAMAPTNMWSLSRSRKFSAQNRNSAGQRSMERIEQAGAEADELAARGDYTGAMRALLFHGLSELSARTDTPISASLTSREIQRRAALPPGSADALADMIVRVEISYYGTYRPGAEDYEGCRRSFEALKNSLAEEFGT